jgi:hypothetical protein
VGYVLHQRNEDLGRADHGGSRILRIRHYATVGTATPQRVLLPWTRAGRLGAVVVIRIGVVSKPRVEHARRARFTRLSAAARRCCWSCIGCVSPAGMAGCGGAPAPSREDVPSSRPSESPPLSAAAMLSEVNDQAPIRTISQAQAAALRAAAIKDFNRAFAARLIDAAHLAVEIRRSNACQPSWQIS